jgi:2,6-dihydroxypyridine 3-monooxygenase
MSPNGTRVVVMGGSLGGLNAALWLRDAGCEVEVYERSDVLLAGQGAGIVLNPATVRYFTENDVLDLGKISVPARYLRYLGRNGATIDEQPRSYLFSSYNALYRGLLDYLGKDRYHLGAAVEGFEGNAEGVTVRIGGNRTERCDMLVCADGIRSTARQLLLPDVSLEYAGYVAWRGTAEEGGLKPATYGALSEAISYHVMPDGHALAYPIPMVDRSPGPVRPHINWLWYRNVAQGPELDDLMTDKSGERRVVSLPPGVVQQRQIDRLREDAASVLPPPFAEMVLTTAEPYVQVIVDVEVPRMAFGRVALIGDAAFAARPHAAAGTAKAAEDAFRLGEAIGEANGDVVVALERWEPGQLELGRRVLQRTREAGRRSQFDGTWRVGDPLPFGLYEIGDSEMSAVARGDERGVP